METTTIKLGDGSHICDKCLLVHYPTMDEPTFGWQAAECDYCRQAKEIADHGGDARGRRNGTREQEKRRQAMKMTIKLGDGSHICDKCLLVHYPTMDEPTFGWQAAECDYCRQAKENRETETENVGKGDMPRGA